MLTSIGPARLVVVRGNSASGKSSVAAELRARYGQGLALVGQDNLRKVVLRERDVAGGANIGLIDLTVRHALEHGFHTVLEGILCTQHYGDMLKGLLADYTARAHCFYLDVPFEETLTRHATKPIAHEVSEQELREWYQALDLLPGGTETVVPASSSLDATVSLIMRETGLDRPPPPSPCGPRL
ncbi:AAA family ATPase [Streptomyces sp. NBC_00083]|uniref:AAA family ATPase n=1 Tax=Streptomyces sp. NBC_00083 TaxID=2975647 RepID=UPI00224E22DE|nr:AAA family ATPase [Streptomyces sp. NBC_00083]MCX5387245.1 kinase [Streptomyces sp. NBC_00083]